MGRLQRLVGGIERTGVRRDGDDVRIALAGVEGGVAMNLAPPMAMNLALQLIECCMDEFDANVFDGE